MESKDIVKYWKEEWDEKIYKHGDIGIKRNIFNEQDKLYKIASERHFRERRVDINVLNFSDQLAYRNDCLGLLTITDYHRLSDEKQRDCTLKIIIHEKSLIDGGYIQIPKYDWIEFIDIREIYQDQKRVSKIVHTYNLEKGWCEDTKPQFIFETEVDGVAKFYNGLFYKNRNHQIGKFKYKYWDEDLCFVKAIIEHLPSSDPFIEFKLRERR